VAVSTKAVSLLLLMISKAGLPCPVSINYKDIKLFKVVLIIHAALTILAGMATGRWRLVITEGATGDRLAHRR
jgi:hypothetical protein